MELFSLRLERQSLDSLFLQTMTEHDLPFYFYGKHKEPQSKTFPPLWKWLWVLVIPLCFPQKEFEKEMEE